MVKRLLFGFMCIIYIRFRDLLVQETAQAKFADWLARMVAFPKISLQVFYSPPAGLRPTFDAVGGSSLRPC